MAKKLLTALFLSILAINVFAQSPSGSWEGTLEAGANKLRLVFNFGKDANGNTICSMDSPDQGAKGIPANASIADNGEITVSIPALGVTYEATMKNGLITGIFKQSGYSFDLTLHPGKSEVRRPQNPQPPYPYTTEEVSFTNRDGNAVLHGTLTLPESFGTKGTTPVVLMVTGSGQQNRDEEVFGHKPFMVIADYLARNGIASLRYDDRGVGESTGDAGQCHHPRQYGRCFGRAQISEGPQRFRQDRHTRAQRGRHHSLHDRRTSPRGCGFHREPGRLGRPWRHVACRAEPADTVGFGRTAGHVRRLLPAACRRIHIQDRKRYAGRCGKYGRQPRVGNRVQYSRPKPNRTSPRYSKPRYRGSTSSWHTIRTKTRPAYNVP